ncbi:putative aspartic peptidase A1 family [Helianthus annuus]|nr:putative aspartic peptidase A1 family [Helianthus annuus]
MGAFLIIPAAVLMSLLQGVVVVCSFPATLKLERAFPHNNNNNNLNLVELRDRDYSRHRRFLQHASSKDVIDFSLLGTYDPYRVGYFLSPPSLLNETREHGFSYFHFFSLPSPVK